MSLMPKGAEVFNKNCASCHRLGGVGTHVGPDMSDTFRRTPEALRCPRAAGRVRLTLSTRKVASFTGS